MGPWCSQDLLVKLSLGRIVLHENIVEDPHELQACPKAETEKTKENSAASHVQEGEG